MLGCSSAFVDIIIASCRSVHVPGQSEGAGGGCCQVFHLLAGGRITRMRYLDEPISVSSQ
jgi:hypothetical protein